MRADRDYPRSCIMDVIVKLFDIADRAAGSKLDTFVVSMTRTVVNCAVLKAVQSNTLGQWSEQCTSWCLRPLSLTRQRRVDQCSRLPIFYDTLAKSAVKKNSFVNTQIQTGYSKLSGQQMTTKPRRKLDYCKSRKARADLRAPGQTSLVERRQSRRRAVR